MSALLSTFTKDTGSIQFTVKRNNGNGGEKKNNCEIVSPAIPNLDRQSVTEPEVYLCMFFRSCVNFISGSPLILAVSPVNIFNVPTIFSGCAGS